MKPGIGQRIRAERERKKISQERLAKAVGWNHHQIVSEVEQEKRELKAWELSAIAQFLSVGIDVLLGGKETTLQPYVLWREKPVQDEKLLEARFLTECDNYVWVEQAISHPESSTVVFEELPSKKIDLPSFTFDQAYSLAENVRQTMALGDFPAMQMLPVLQDRYGIKFIVGNGEGSAACSRSEKGSFIFINSRNVEPRQYFSVAHELFHLITWDSEMLQLVDGSTQFHEKNEQLANAFAAGLLIPHEKVRSEVTRICTNRSISASDVLALAEQFQVSKDAMLYRLLNVKLLSKKEFEQVKEQLQKVAVFNGVHPTVTYFLKSKFVRLVYLACEQVKISRAKAAKLLHIDLCDLSSLFHEYGFVELKS